MTVAGRSRVIRELSTSATCLQIVWFRVKTIYDTTDQSALTVHYWTEPKLHNANAANADVKCIIYVHCPEPCLYLPH